MTYETMNWELEFERIRRAFGVMGECEILRETDYISLEIKGQEWGEHLPLYDGAGLRTGYSLRNKSFGFCLFVNDVFTEFTMGKDYVWVFAMYGHIPEEDLSTLPLAKGLFHLGLLTPEVEAEMNISVTTHEKLEWTLEYEARLEAL